MEIVVEDEPGREVKRVAIMERHCAAQDSLVGDLGLNMADSKILLGAVQRHCLEMQVQSVSSNQTHCQKYLQPMMRK